MEAVPPDEPAAALPSDAAASPPNEDLPEPPIVSPAETLRLLPYAQLGLRLLGVMLFCNGIGNVVGAAVQAFVNARNYEEAGYTYSLDPHSAGWMASGVPLLVSGFWLMTDNEWLLKKIFSALPPNGKREDHQGGKSPAEDPC